MISDCHLHTCFSGDSETPPEVMVERAIELGMKVMCFTDHRDVDHPEQLFTLNTPAYIAKMKAVQEQYRDKIDIRIGVELGMQEHLVKENSEYIAKYPFDFIIGSVHIVNGEDPYNPQFFEGKSDEQAFNEYFEAICRNVKLLSGFQTLGHLDYVVRYAKQSLDLYTYANHADILDEILQTIISKGIGLEVNTGGYRNGLEFPNPHPDIFKRYRELGGEIITIGSDAHTPEYIGDEFATVRAMLKDVGFRYVALFKQRRMELERL